LADRLPLLVLIFIFFEGTRSVAIEMGDTGEEKKEDRQEAVQHVKGLWEKAKGSNVPEREPKDKAV
jgi:hypothetical protein